MDDKQIKTLKVMGYMMQELPGKTIPHMTYYKNDGTALPNLPADPYHLKRYLSRGFTIEPPQVAVAKPQDKKFVCETCGAGFDQRIALEGHLRSHKEK